MAQKHFGLVVGNVIEARFAYSGKLVVVKRKTGDDVKKGDLLASLDRKILQAELDKQLANFEQQRAEFEIFAKKNPNTDDEIIKYLKMGQQAQLNTSVKEVELAKVKLDQSDLFSPVTGFVLSDGGNVTGINVTPSSSSFAIMDMESLKFVLEIEESDLDEFIKPKEMKIHFPSLKKQVTGVSLIPRPIQSGKHFTVTIKISDLNGLLPGVTGYVN